MTNPFKASEELFAELAKRMGFFDVRFLTDWKGIVGVDIASKCTPTKIVFDHFSKEGTLLISSENPAFRSMFIHYKALILTRVKFYFGVNFIKDVKITNK